jgi:hypothetical protein
MTPSAGLLARCSYEDYVSEEERLRATGAPARELSRLTDALYGRRREAARMFGALNGWTFVDRDFEPEALVRGHVRPPRQTWRGRPLPFPRSRSHILDHLLYFRNGKRGRPVALVSQPYRLDREELDAFTALRGLRWHLAPRPQASIHYPGAAYFIVLTPPHVEVRWLPEQKG